MRSKGLAEQVKAGKLKPEDIDETVLAKRFIRRTCPTPTC